MGNHSGKLRAFTAAFTAALTTVFTTAFTAVPMPLVKQHALSYA